jgi:nucleoid-associated protein YgaU
MAEAPMKAKLTMYDTLGGSYGQDPIEVWLNPNKLVLTKGVDWKAHDNPGLNLPEYEFTIGKAETLSFELFVDTSRQEDGKEADVRTICDRIRKLTLIHKDKHHPPIVEFAWGAFKFRGFITSLTQTFTMFSRAGYPLRATLNINMTQFRKAIDQKMETENCSPDHTKVHTVKQGETLDSIAFREYDDPVHWKLIAEANDIDNPTRLIPGQRLTLPRLF